MKNKHIYIDESGGAINNTVICFVVFAKLEDVQHIDKVISDFKLLSNKEDAELHFNKENTTTKKRFFKNLPNNRFYIKYYLYKNNKLSNTDLMTKSFIENRDLIQNSNIFIDGLKIRKYNRKVIGEIKKELKKYNIKIRSIKYTDSKNSNLIQLADMCAGCIRRKVERGTKEDNDLFNIIKKFIK